MQKIYIGIGIPGETIERIADFTIEEFDRDDVKEVVGQVIDLVYDGEYAEGGDDTA